MVLYLFSERWLNDLNISSGLVLTACLWLWATWFSQLFFFFSLYYLYWISQICPLEKYKVRKQVNNIFIWSLQIKYKIFFINVNLDWNSCVCVLHMQGDPLWSARLLHTDPQAIRDAHYRCVHAKMLVNTNQSALNVYTLCEQVPPQWCWCHHDSHIPGKYPRIHQPPGGERWTRQRAADVRSSSGQRDSEEVWVR